MKCPQSSEEEDLYCTFIVFCCLQQDIFCAGPPCQPYSRLSGKRRKPGFLPFSEEDGIAFLECARHIRHLVNHSSSALQV